MAKRKVIQCGREAPNLGHVFMYDPAGHRCKVVTQTNINHHPTANDYGRVTIEEKKLKGWLRGDVCPLNDGSVHPYSTPHGPEPCPPGSAMPCPHLKFHVESRRKNYEEARLARRERMRSEEKRKAEESQQIQQRTLEAIERSLNKNESNNSQSEIQALRAELAEMKQALAKPKRKRTKKEATDER